MSRSHRFLPLLSVLLAALFLLSCAGGPPVVETPPDYRLPRYPVYLVHGIGFTSKNLTFNYWEGVMPVLDKLGVQYFQSSQPAFGLIADNAAILKRDILVYLAAHPETEKVHIIAHSRGGLESRWMITHLDMADKVASLSMLATPHRGSPAADYIYERVGSREHLLVKTLGAYLALKGEDHSDAYSSGLQLTTGNMAAFNALVPNVPGVYYQSWSAVIDETYQSPVWTGIARVLEKQEGPNDGLVSTESARWGIYRGAIQGASHAGIINLKRFDGEHCLDTAAFYRDLLGELAEMGL